MATLTIRLLKGEVRKMIRRDCYIFQVVVGSQAINKTYKRKEIEHSSRFLDHRVARNRFPVWHPSCK